MGFSSLGSFSSRFTRIVGEAPSAFQQRYGGNAPRIPGCYLFMGGYLEDDCRKTQQELTARGVVFIRKPQERPYGVDALMRDNSGN